VCVLSPPPTGTPCHTTQHRAIDRSIPHHRVSENHSFCASADFGAPSPLCPSERQELERNNLVNPNLIPSCSSICWPFCTAAVNTSHAQSREGGALPQIAVLRAHILHLWYIPLASWQHRSCLRLRALARQACFLTLDLGVPFHTHRKKKEKKNRRR
jgi:hypothetical protein